MRRYSLAVAVITNELLGSSATTEIPEDRSSGGNVDPPPARVVVSAGLETTASLAPRPSEPRFPAVRLASDDRDAEPKPGCEGAAMVGAATGPDPVELSLERGASAKPDPDDDVDRKLAPPPPREEA